MREALLAPEVDSALPDVEQSFLLPLTAAERAALLLELLPLAGDCHLDGALAAGRGIALGTGAGGLDGV